MAKSDELAEHLARAQEWARKRSRVPGGKGSARLGFIAVEEVVSLLLDNGFMASDAFEYLKSEGLVSMSYHRFAHYVRERLRGGKDGRFQSAGAAVNATAAPAPPARTAPPQAPPEGGAAGRGPLKIPPAGTRGFVFDPDRPVEDF